MMDSTAQIVELAQGAMVFDPRVLGAAPDPHWLDAAYWQAQNAVMNAARGRGEALIVRTPVGEAVLRPYRRGGLVARLLGANYLWTGAARTRPFREFRVLQYARAQGLNVPEPWAACYRRARGFYRASLLMRAIEHTETLAQRLAHAPDAIDWRAVGEAIARMHAAKIWHADLNAHNVLFDRAQRVWIVDFDKAEVRAPNQAWQSANLVRLKRSLMKLGAQRTAPDFEHRYANELCVAHAHGLERAAS